MFVHKWPCATTGIYLAGVTLGSRYTVCFFGFHLAFRCPEIKATEVKAENITSVAFISGYITKLAESIETHCRHSQSKRM